MSSDNHHGRRKRKKQTSRHGRQGGESRKVKWQERVDDMVWFDELDQNGLNPQNQSELHLLTRHCRSVLTRIDRSIRSERGEKPLDKGTRYELLQLKMKLRKCPAPGSLAEWNVVDSFQRFILLNKHIPRMLDDDSLSSFYDCRETYRRIYEENTKGYCLYPKLPPHCDLNAVLSLCATLRCLLRDTLEQDIGVWEGYMLLPYLQGIQVCLLFLESDEAWTCAKRGLNPKTVKYVTQLFGIGRDSLSLASLCLEETRMKMEELTDRLDRMSHEFSKSCFWHPKYNVEHSGRGGQSNVLHTRKQLTRRAATLLWETPASGVLDCSVLKSLVEIRLELMNCPVREDFYELDVLVLFESICFVDEIIPNLLKNNNIPCLQRCKDLVVETRSQKWVWPDMQLYVKGNTSPCSFDELWSIAFVLYSRLADMCRVHERQHLISHAPETIPYLLVVKECLAFMEHLLSSNNFIRQILAREERHFLRDLSMAGKSALKLAVLRGKHAADILTDIGDIIAKLSLRLSVCRDSGINRMEGTRNRKWAVSTNQPRLSYSCQSSQESERDSKFAGLHTKRTLKTQIDSEEVCGTTQTARDITDEDAESTNETSMASVLRVSESVAAVSMSFEDGEIFESPISLQSDQPHVAIRNDSRPQDSINEWQSQNESGGELQEQDDIAVLPEQNERLPSVSLNSNVSDDVNGKEENHLLQLQHFQSLMKREEAALARVNSELADIDERQETIQGYLEASQSLLDDLSPQVCEFTIRLGVLQRLLQQNNEIII